MENISIIDFFKTMDISEDLMASILVYGLSSDEVFNIILEYEG